MHNDLERYWASIPVGRKNRVTYSRLMSMWEMSERQVRRTLARLSYFDNGDNYVLIRSSRHCGFYRTDDPDDIAAYKRECQSRARKTFAQLRKINRVLHSTAPDQLNYNFFNNLQLMRKQRGMTQTEVCAFVREIDSTFDCSTLSKLENGYVLPTPAQLRTLADILNCEPFELVAMERDGADIYIAESGLQVPQTQK